MGEVVKFEDLDADLEKPKWFYKECEDMAHRAYEKFRELVESCPFGSLTIDDLFDAHSETPTRLMALKEGDLEAEHYIMDAAVFRAVIAKMSNAS